MTLEELKLEADKLGYKLIKKSPYIKLSPCICGRKQINEWWNSKTEVYFYKCPKCDLEAPGAEKHNEARQKWNDMIEEEMKCKTECTDS